MPKQMRAAFADEIDVNIYSRFSNPTVDEFVQRVCALEGAETGYATASGMSAVFASFMALMKQGDHLLSCNAIFGSTHTVITKILSKYGIDYTYVSATATAEEWKALRQCFVFSTAVGKSSCNNFIKISFFGIAPATRHC